MHVCVWGNQIAADWFLEGMALKDKAQGHQALWALTSQRGSRVTALPLRLSGPNILWRLVVIKIGYFNFFYYKVLFSSWTNIILKIFICFGRLPFIQIQSTIQQPNSNFSSPFQRRYLLFLYLYLLKVLCVREWCLCSLLVSPSEWRLLHWCDLLASPHPLPPAIHSGLRRKSDLPDW